MSVELTDPIRWVHNLICGVMFGLLIGFAITATVWYSTDSCDGSGQLGGDQKCQFTAERIWALGFFYGGAVIFLLGTFGSGTSNGYAVILYLICLVVWIFTFGTVVIIRMTSKDALIWDAIQSYIGEVLPDYWGFWATLAKWVLLIGYLSSLAITIFLVVVFLYYKQL